MGELFQARRRGLISDARFRHGLRKARLETLWDDSMVGLLDVLLSPSELANARQQGIAAGKDIPGLPPMTVHVAGVMVEPGQRGMLEATLSSGTYGLVCRRDSPTGKAEAIYVKGPFQVD